ncbi:unnamed protein product, partial [Rotaria socialis]
TLTPVQNAYRYHQLYKESILHIVPEANHSLLIEHPQEALDAIEPFLLDR